MTSPARGVAVAARSTATRCSTRSSARLEARVEALRAGYFDVATWADRQVDDRAGTVTLGRRPPRRSGPWASTRPPAAWSSPMPRAGTASASSTRGEVRRVRLDRRGGCNAMARPVFGRRERTARGGRRLAARPRPTARRGGPAGPGPVRRPVSEVPRPGVRLRPLRARATTTPRRTRPSACSCARSPHLPRFEERARPEDGDGASTFRVWLFQIARNVVAERAPQRGAAGPAPRSRPRSAPDWSSPTRSTSRRTPRPATRRPRRCGPLGPPARRPAPRADPALRRRDDDRRDRRRARPVRGRRPGPDPPRRCGAVARDLAGPDRAAMTAAPSRPATGRRSTCSSRTATSTRSSRREAGAPTHRPTPALDPDDPARGSTPCARRSSASTRRSGSRSGSRAGSPSLAGAPGRRRGRRGRRSRARPSALGRRPAAPGDPRRHLDPPTTASSTSTRASPPPAGRCSSAARSRRPRCRSSASPTSPGGAAGRRPAERDGRRRAAARARLAARPTSARPPCAALGGLPDAPPFPTFRRGARTTRSRCGRGARRARSSCSTSSSRRPCASARRAATTSGSPAPVRLAQLLDEDSFEERDAGLVSEDPLGFVDQKAYPDRVAAAQLATGLRDAADLGLRADRGPADRHRRHGLRVHGRLDGRRRRREGRPGRRGARWPSGSRWSWSRRPAARGCRKVRWP